jgi:hypothetical protein
MRIWNGHWGNGTTQGRRPGDDSVGKHGETERGKIGNRTQFTNQFFFHDWSTTEGMATIIPQFRAKKTRGDSGCTDYLRMERAGNRRANLLLRPSLWHTWQRLPQSWTCKAERRGWVLFSQWGTYFYVSWQSGKMLNEVPIIGAFVDEGWERVGDSDGLGITGH